MVGLHNVAAHTHLKQRSIYTRCSMISLRQRSTKRGPNFHSDLRLNHATFFVLGDFVKRLLGRRINVALHVALTNVSRCE